MSTQNNLQTSPRTPRFSSLLLLVVIVVVSLLAGRHWGGAAGSASAVALPARLTCPPDVQTTEHAELAGTPFEPPHIPLVPSTMAGEFARQSAILLGGGDLIVQNPDIFVALVAAAHEEVRLIAMAPSSLHRRLAEDLLRQHGLPEDAVTVLINPARTMWARDYGPQFVRRADGRAEILDVDYARDEQDITAFPEDAAPTWIGWQFGLPVVKIPLCLDGGNFLTNGEGLCITTSAVVDANEDRGYEPDQIRVLVDLVFGCKTWVCLRPLAGEETEHVDMFVTFVSENIAVVAQCDPTTDPVNAAILDEAAAALAGLPTSKGPMQVHRVPMPDSRDGIFRSYTNVIFANNVLLVPVYSDADPEQQTAAFDLYARLLPDKKIVGINADALIRLGGSLHCIAMNVPDFVGFAPQGTPALQAMERPQ